MYELRDQNRSTNMVTRGFDSNTVSTATASVTQTGVKHEKMNTT